MRELPTIAHAVMSTNAISLATPSFTTAGHVYGRVDEWDSRNSDAFDQIYNNKLNQGSITLTHVKPPKETPVANPARRLVRVLVVDPDDNVPTDKCLLHSGAEQFTDATDQELFFEIDIRSILEKHNEYRVTLVDRDVTDKERKLEPARIRDLKMVVVTIAGF